MGLSTHSTHWVDSYCLSELLPVRCGLSGGQQKSMLFITRVEKWDCCVMIELSSVMYFCCVDTVASLCKSFKENFMAYNQLCS